MCRDISRPHVRQQHNVIIILPIIYAYNTDGVEIHREEASRKSKKTMDVIIRNLEKLGIQNGEEKVQKKRRMERGIGGGKNS